MGKPKVVNAARQLCGPLFPKSQPRDLHSPSVDPRIATHPRMSGPSRNCDPLDQNGRTNGRPVRRASATERCTKSANDAQSSIVMETPR